MQARLHETYTVTELAAANAIVSFKDEHAFLSNFHHTWIKYDDIWFKTNEHAYVYAKLRSLGALRLNRKLKAFAISYNGERINTITYEEFNSLHPGAVKRIGREVPPATADHLLTWDKKTKFDVMKTLIKLKFKDVRAEELLLATGSRIIIEGNTWGDRVWGAVSNGTKYVGDNRLGRLIMQRRDKLKG